MLQSCLWKKKFCGVSSTLYRTITLLLDKPFLAVVSKSWIYKWSSLLYISNPPAFNMSNCTNHASVKDKANRGRGCKNNLKAVSHEYYTECLQNHFYTWHLEVLSEKMTRKSSLWKQSARWGFCTGNVDVYWGTASTTHKIKPPR